MHNVYNIQNALIVTYRTIENRGSEGMNTVLTPKEAYKYVEGVGVKKSEKKMLITLTAGILAGMFIALGGFAAAMASVGIANYSLAKLVAGFIFPVGLILVVMCGAELFTGNNLLAVALYEKKISIQALMKNWAIVYFGNFIGCALVGIMVYYSGLLEGHDGALGGYAIKVAANKVALPFSQGLLRGILCNILVCMAVWGSYSVKTETGKMAMLHVPVMAFIIAGFEHSVANMYYFTLGFLAKGNEIFIEASHKTIEQINNIDLLHIIGNLIPVTLGNIMGGVVFVSGLYWVTNKK